MRTKQPYGEWLDRYLVELKDLKIPNERVDRVQRRGAATYSRKPLVILMKMYRHHASYGKNGAEGIASMGIDTPLAVLSDDHQPLFNYFKQLFAQVTNPPIDAIREESGHIHNSLCW